MFSWIKEVMVGIAVSVSALFGLSHSTTVPESTSPQENGSSTSRVVIQDVTVSQATSTNTSGSSSVQAPASTSNQEEYYFTKQHTEYNGQVNLLVSTEYIGTADASIREYMPGEILSFHGATLGTKPVTIIVKKGDKISIQTRGGEKRFLEVADIYTIETAQKNTLHVADIIWTETDLSTVTKKIYNGSDYNNTFSLIAKNYSEQISFSLLAVGNNKVILELRRGHMIVD